MTAPSARKNEDWLVHQWVAAGIVAAAARFVPLPFVDDVIRDQCRRFVVLRTLAAHGLARELEELEPFYAGTSKGLSGCLVSMFTAPFKLLLFPVRKLVAIVTSIRGVPLEVTRTILLGRTLDRCLDRGEAMSTDHSVAMRKAFEQSFRHMDLRALRAAVRSAMAGVHKLNSAAKADAKRTYDGDRSAEEINTSPKIDEGAQKVQQVLDRPEILELLTEFDKQFDQAVSKKH